MIETLTLFTLGTFFGIVLTLAGIYVYAKLTMKRIESKIGKANRLLHDDLSLDREPTDIELRLVEDFEEDDFGIGGTD